MTRKLFSLTLSAFALLLLMGAGVEQSSAALVSESDGRPLRRLSVRWTRNKIRKRIGRSRCLRWRGEVS